MAKTIKFEKSLWISFLFILTAILFNSNVMADVSEEETDEELFFDDNGLAGNNSNRSQGNESVYQCLGPTQVLISTTLYQRQQLLKAEPFYK